MSNAKSLFERVKKAVARLHDIQLMIMNHCDEWRPPSVSSRSAVSDPTANTAIRNVDEIDPRICALRVEENELIDFIGNALAIIQGVRDGLGEKYGNILEWRYIDCLTWDYITDEYDVTKSTGHRTANVAFDWIDSIGISRILAGDFDI